MAVQDDGRTRRTIGHRFGPFRHRAYTAYWLGVSITSLGTWLQAVAGSVFVYQLTGSSFDVGVFNFVAFIPILLFSVWGGQLSDRFDRRWVVWTTHALSMAIAALLAALTIAGAANEITLIASMFLLNTLWALGKPALLSLVPNIVPPEDLHDGVALSSMGFQIGQIVGPLLAAVAMAASGAGLAFAINALTYGAPMIAMFYLRRIDLGGRATLPGRPRGANARAVSAATFVRKNGWVLGLLTGVVVTSMAMEIQRPLAPAFVFEKLGIPTSNAGLLVAAQSVGSMIGFMLFVQIRKYGWSRRAAFIGLLIQAMGVVVAAVAPNLPIAFVGFGLIGLGFSLCFPVLTAALQSATPDGLRGRLMAFHQMAQLGHRPITALIIGSVAAGLGLEAGVLVWLALVPIGLLAVRAAWRRLPVAPAIAHPSDGPGDATAEPAQRSMAATG